jgi:hypothetical protein
MRDPLVKGIVPLREARWINGQLVRNSGAYDQYGSRVALRTGHHRGDLPG